jgi:hypothetical protein
MITHPQVAPMTLPQWCSDYLHQVSQALLAINVHGRKTTARISQALGFTGSGRSAIKARASADRAIRAALQYEELRWNKMTANQAYEVICSKNRLAEVDSARKLVREGKKMLAHVPSRNHPSTTHKLTRQEAAILRALNRRMARARQVVLGNRHQARKRSP